MSLLDPFERIAELDENSSHSSADRKKQGITYTPPAVARAMVDMLALREYETVFEPSCGRGVFVFALVQYWLGLGKSLAWIDQWAQEHLFACDLDEKAVKDLQQLWLDYFLDNGHEAQPLNAYSEDGLFGALSTRKFDAIVGNPPYVRIQNLDEATRGKIRGKYRSCQKGNVDLYYAFMEDALSRADRVCLITPNSWMSNDSAKFLRQLILPRLSEVVDFGTRLIFSPVRAYTAIVLCQLNPGSTIRVRGNLPNEGGDDLHIPRTDLRWAEERFTPLIQSRNNTGLTLGDRFEVLSGIATLADKSFILPSPRIGSDGNIFQTDPLDHGYEVRVPEEYAPRLIKITKPGKLDKTGARILYPYTSKGTIQSEAILHQKAPGLLDWLERRREILDGRDNGKTQGYEAWYAYGRKQGLWQAQDDENLLLLPLMGNGALNPIQISTGDIGPFLFTSGFVIRPKPGQGPDTLEMLAQYLRSAQAWEFVQQEGKAWAGKGDYRTLGARALRRMPLPIGFK